MTQRGRKENHF